MIGKIGTGVGYAPHGTIVFDTQEVGPGTHPLLRDLALGAMLCNDAELAQTEAGWNVQGDPMEGALVAFACKAGLVTGDVRRANPQTDAIPFDAQHRFMATLHHDQHNTAAIHVKGAPERILAMCADQQAEGDKAGPLDAEYWQRAASKIAAQGQRVLAIATRRGPEGGRKLTFDDVEGGLTLLGLVGLIDPPRKEAIAAVAECQAASIRVKMITGDHAGTALAIARQLGRSILSRFVMWRVAFVSILFCSVRACLPGRSGRAQASRRLALSRSTLWW